MSVMNIVTACIVILIMAVLSVVAIRFGYKALLIEWAIDAISKAEKEFVGTKLGEARRFSCPCKHLHPPFSPPAVSAIRSISLQEDDPRANPQAA